MDRSRVRSRLAHTTPPEDPRLVDVPSATASWPDDLRRSLTENLKPAGVLVPIVEHETGLTVLLTERSRELKHHAGQVAFPGGQMEAGDSDIVVTALRETEEEVGICRQTVSIAGYLPPMPTVTGYAVTPVVGLVPGPVDATIDRSEVYSVFEVPMPFLLDQSNIRRGERQYAGRTMPVVEYVYEGRRIWGATAHMLIELRKILI